MNNTVECLEKKVCTGCKMCKDICPQNAISYETDDEGFWYPLIDKQKCVDCGLCYKKCPALIDVPSKEEHSLRVFEAFSRDGQIRDMSTSGGLFYEFAHSILQDGGYVVGSTYTEDYKGAKHIMIDSEEHLYKLMGTKYFQSDTELIYENVKKQLETGKKVLFAGTPCQNSAVRCFLGREYENLYQMDFICNSITSPLVYKKWIEEKEDKAGAPVSHVRFKDKKYGWKQLSLILKFENGTEVVEKRNDSLWTKGLIKYNLYQRPSCYNCHFRGTDRLCSDITVGDFWGLEGKNPYDDFKGISLVIINTEKGKILFNSIKKKLFYKERTLKEVINGNPKILENPVQKGDRELFFSLLSEEGFEKSFLRSTGETVQAKNNTKLFLKDVKKYIRRKDVSFYNFLYLNYFSKNVERKGEGKIIPYTNSVVELGKNSKIIVDGDRDFEIGKNKLKGSKRETFLRLGENAILNLSHGGIMYVGAMIDIKNNGRMDAGFFSFNTGSAITVKRKMTMGEEVVGGRNCIIMDSDFHQIQTRSGEAINPPKPVYIGDRVWMPGDVRILSGSNIKGNTIIGPYVTIVGEIPMGSSVSSKSGFAINRFDGMWSIRSNDILHHTINSKSGYKQILVGYGKEGKEYYDIQKNFITDVIDNNSKESGVVTMDDFTKAHSNLGSEYIFVIGSSKYYDELVKMVKKKYNNHRICSCKEIF